MTTTLDEAYTTLTDYLRAEWPGAVAGICDAVPELRFAAVDQPGLPATYFARFSMQPAGERQANLRNGEAGSQRYTSVGVIYLQVYAPRSDPRAAERHRKLTAVGKNLFRGRDFDGCIWLRNMRINWLEPEAKFYRANVLGEYEYDEQG